MCHPANVKHLHWTPTPRGGGVTCCLHVCLRICSSEACVSPAFFSTLNSPLAVFHSSGLRGKLLLSSPFCLGRGGGRQGEAGPQQPQSADLVGMQKRDLNRRSRGKNRVRRFFFFFSPTWSFRSSWSFGSFLSSIFCFAAFSFSTAPLFFRDLSFPFPVPPLSHYCSYCHTPMSPMQNSPDCRDSNSPSPSLCPAWLPWAF